VAAPVVSVEEARDLLCGPQPPRLIDVRERDEWELARLPGAELLPLSQWPAIATENLTDPQQPLLVYCHHGTRSGHAVEFLESRGFTRATNVAGGIDAWAARIDPQLPRY
jgi:rhodanese-related sulfurtransferase